MVVVIVVYGGNNRVFVRDNGVFFHCLVKISLLFGTILFLSMDLEIFTVYYILNSIAESGNIKVSKNWLSKASFDRF